MDLVARAVAVRSPSGLLFSPSGAATPFCFARHDDMDDLNDLADAGAPRAEVSAGRAAKKPAAAAAAADLTHLVINATLRTGV